MHYDHEILNRMSSTTYYDIDLSQLGPRVKNTVIKALTQGAIPFDSGVAATAYTILCDAFGLPMMAYSNRTTYTLTVKRLPAEATEPISQWWNVDRVTFRVEHPEEWHSWVSQDIRHSYYRKRTTMPDWIRDGQATVGTDHIPILTQNNKSIQASFLAIAKTFSDTQEYKDKVAPIIKKVAAGAIIQLKSFNKQISGV